jgi:hypothetical protein
MPQNAVIIDAATRFLRSNPELLALARRGAGETGRGVEDLLTDAVGRAWTSGLQAVAEKQMVVRPAHRVERGSRQPHRSGGPAVDDARPYLRVVASRDPGRDRQEQLVYSSSRHQAAEK